MAVSAKGRVQPEAGPFKSLAQDDKPLQIGIIGLFTARLVLDHEHSLNADLNQPLRNAGTVL